MKKKLDPETKIKLVYSAELAIIAIVVLVLGILKLVGVIQTKPTRLLVYNIITTIGAAWFIFEIIWYFVSPKKRARTCLMDKLMTLPLSGYLVYFDICCFIDKATGVETNDLFVRISIGAVLLYVAIIYSFQAIYHFKYPIPQVEEAIKEYYAAKEQEEEEERQKALLEEQKNSENQDNNENNPQ